MKRILLAILIVLGLFLAGCPVKETTTTTQATTTMIEVTDTTQPAQQSDTSAPTDADIRVLGPEGFDPEVINLAAGGTVTWIIPGASSLVKEDLEDEQENDDDQDDENSDMVTAGRVHLISSNDGLFRSPRLFAGDEFSYTFEEAGEYEYTNVIWGRKGTVIVE
ncbi:MAG: hypothetical protein ABII01_02740 [Candidatus Woesearchaeota archaeon]